MSVLGLTRYGLRTVIILMMITAGVVLLIAAAAAAWGTPLWLLAVIPGAFFVWVLVFFRDPERQPPEGEGLFVSPADGRVADITLIGPDSPLGCRGVKIGIFMNVVNVHVNRAPLSGRVERVEHHAGSFMDVRRPAAFERNESTSIFITHLCQDEEYPVVVRQVAGLLARRIVTDLEVGQMLLRGQRIGMIKFGSRLELMVPDTLVGEMCVKVGARVFAGRTALLKAAWAMRAAPPGEPR
ncbi:MAG: phosphatidylserine decarboxylase [Planctomycetaceae bacterium]|nr:phosphatidylserine decarboxylase [Planctomycetaceae bacterium]